MNDPLLMMLEALRLEIRAHAAATTHRKGNPLGEYSSPAERAAVRFQDKADKLAHLALEKPDA